MAIIPLLLALFWIPIWLFAIYPPKAEAHFGVAVVGMIVPVLLFVLGAFYLQFS